MEKEQLEKKALDMIRKGMKHKEIEKELQHEFIFYRDFLTDEYVRATLWK